MRPVVQRVVLLVRVGSTYGGGYRGPGGAAGGGDDDDDGGVVVLVVPLVVVIAAAITVVVVLGQLVMVLKMVLERLVRSTIFCPRLIPSHAFQVAPRFRGC